ncbi:hypothetical protein GQ53DRAFT_508258 [Thozetella sp. PMI_491]|nr:hypothetical protein GQ53DRAFT_508258 [Thozetella sp. PMI_491]
MGLCGMQRALWRYNTMRQEDGQADHYLEDQLAKQLDFWKAQLDRVSDLRDAQQPQAYDATFSLRFYQGSETAVSPPTLARFISLVRDTTLLFNTISLHLYSNKYIVSRFSRSQLPLGAETICSTPSYEHNTRMREWARSENGRRAVSLSITTLEAREEILSTGGHQREFAEPLTDLALSNSATVFFAWLESTEDQCNCGNAPVYTGPLGTEDWRSGGNTPAVGGGWLCKCRVDGWMRRFAAARDGH